MKHYVGLDVSLKETFICMRQQVYYCCELKSGLN